MINLENKTNKNIVDRVVVMEKDNRNIISRAKNAKKENDHSELIALRFNIKEKLDEKYFDFEVVKAELQLLQHCWQMVSIR